MNEASNCGFIQLNLFYSALYELEPEMSWSLKSIEDQVHQLNQSLLPPVLDR